MGRAGTVVFLDTDADGILTAGEPASTTAANGAYAFGGLAPGDHHVTVVPTADQTCDASCTQTVTVKGNTVTAGFTIRTKPSLAPPAIIDPGGTGPGGAPRDATKPILSPLSLTRTTFAVNTKGAPGSRLRRGSAPMRWRSAAGSRPVRGPNRCRPLGTRSS